MPDPQPFSIQIPVTPPPQSRAAPPHSSPRPATTRPSPHRTTRYVALPGSFSFTFTGSNPPSVLTPAQELSITPTVRTIIVFSILMVFVFGFVVSVRPGSGITSPSQVPIHYGNPIPNALPKCRLVCSENNQNRLQHHSSILSTASKALRSTPASMARRMLH